MLVLTTAGVVVALATLWYTRKEYQLSTRESNSSPRGAGEGSNEVTKNDGEGVPQGHSEKGLDTLSNIFWVYIIVRT